jgi:hypothetical protein
MSRLVRHLKIRRAKRKTGGSHGRSPGFNSETYPRRRHQPKDKMNHLVLVKLTKDAPPASPQPPTHAPATASTEPQTIFLQASSTTMAI